MDNENLTIYLEAVIENLEKNLDNDGYIKGYIQACEDVLEKIKG